MHRFQVLLQLKHRFLSLVQRRFQLNMLGDAAESMPLSCQFLAPFDTANGVLIAVLGAEAAAVVLQGDRTSMGGAAGIPDSDTVITTACILSAVAFSASNLRLRPSNVSITHLIDRGRPYSRKRACTACSSASASGCPTVRNLRFLWCMAWRYRSACNPA